MMTPRPIRAAVNHLPLSHTLFATARRPDRPWGAVVVSAALHVVVIAAGSYVAREAMSAPMPSAARELTFFAVLSAPDPSLIFPLKPLPLPAAVKEPPKIPEIVPPALEPPPIPEKRADEIKPVEPKPPEPRHEDPAKVEPPKPTVTVGAFESGAATARTVEPVRTVENAGFDAPMATGLGIKTRSASVGAFDQAASGATASGTARSRVVTDGGFGTATTSALAQPRTRVLADTGFGASRAEAAPASRPRQEVQTTDFDAKPAPKTTAAAPREPRIDVQLEILSKPTPAYTDEARTLKIEGDVLLDVQFAASGEIRVLRVVRGLGHGLDESACRAAQGIRFKPAQSAGHAIDFRTTVHIVFRLA